MINSVKQAIIDKLLECWPDCIVYDETILQDFRTKSFLIALTNQDFRKGLFGKFSSTLSFDLSYFSDRDAVDIRADCLQVQDGLFRQLDLVGTYRVLNKKASITEDVLHFTFDIRYSAVDEAEYSRMQQIQANIRMEG